MSSGRKPRTAGDMYFFIPCQIDVLNKQIFSQLDLNKPLPKTAFGESYTLMIDRNLDAKKGSLLGC